MFGIQVHTAASRGEGAGDADQHDLLVGKVLLRLDVSELSDRISKDNLFSGLQDKFKLLQKTKKTMSRFGNEHHD
jgi:hypothetical protein